MATYLELLDCAGNDGLNQKIRVAVVIAAEAIRTENPATANHTARLAWGKSAYSSPETAARSAIWAVLAQNAGATQAAILSASDAAIQAAVDAAVDALS